MLTRTFLLKIIESFLLSVISDEEEVMPSFLFSVKQDYIHSCSFGNCRKNLGTGTVYFFVPMAPPDKRTRESCGLD